MQLNPVSPLTFPRSARDSSPDVCLLCGEDRPTPLFLTPDFQVVSCPRCGLAWRCDQPTRLQDPTTAHADAIPSIRLWESDSGLEEIEEIAQFKKPPGTLLTVGPQGEDIVETARLYGWLPQVMKRFDDEYAAAEKALAVSSSQPPSPASGWDVEGGYDVIRLQGALERSPHPLQCLEWVKSYLGEKGLLVVGATDFSDWDFPLRGEGAMVGGFDLPRWFFAPHVLKRLLDGSGFRILKISRFTTALPALPTEPIMDTVARLRPEIKSKSGAFQSLKRIRMFARLDERRPRQRLSHWEYQSFPEGAPPLRRYSVSMEALCPS